MMWSSMPTKKGHIRRNISSLDGTDLIFPADEIWQHHSQKVLITRIRIY